MFKSQSIFAKFLVVILTFIKKINILRIRALKPSKRGASNARGHRAKKLKKKMLDVSRISGASLASLVWLKGKLTETVATHGQAKRDIEHRLHGTCLSCLTESRHLMPVPKQEEQTNVEKSHNLIFFFSEN